MDTIGRALDEILEDLRAKHHNIGVAIQVLEAWDRNGTLDPPAPSLPPAGPDVRPVAVAARTPRPPSAVAVAAEDGAFSALAEWLYDAVGEAGLPVNELVERGKAETGHPLSATLIRTVAESNANLEMLRGNRYVPTRVRRAGDKGEAWKAGKRP